MGQGEWLSGYVDKWLCGYVDEWLRMRDNAITGSRDQEEGSG